MKMSRLHKLENVVWVDPKKLKPHPKNRNKHPKEQIERLAQILNYQGFRKPVVVSNRSGFIVEGHGRVEAALKNKWTTVPVCYQDFEDDTQEYAHLTADNAIALWAELDMSGINADTMELGPFDTDLLGIQSWESIAEDKNNSNVNEFNEMFNIVIQCADEEEQQKLFTEFQERGINSRLMQ